MINISGRENAQECDSSAAGFNNLDGGTRLIAKLQTQSALSFPFDLRGLR